MVTHGENFAKMVSATGGLSSLNVCGPILIQYLFIYYENRTQSTSKKKTNTDRKKDTKIQTHTLKKRMKK